MTIADPTVDELAQLCVALAREEATQILADPASTSTSTT
jgi:hypothetical protein